MENNEAKNASEIKGLKLSSLSFQHHGWGENRRFVATARLSADGGDYKGVKDVTLELDETMTQEIIKLLAPIVAMQAAAAAQKLAEESKALAQGVADAMRQITDKVS